VKVTIGRRLRICETHSSWYAKAKKKGLRD
jgi:hypothetical protein